MALAGQVLDPKELDAFHAENVDAEAQHAARAQYAFMTPKEIAADIKQKAPGGDLSDTGERARGDKTRKAARDEVLAERKKDPAGWAMGDETVAAAIATAEEALENAEPGTPEAEQANREYRRALALRNEVQKDMGATPRLLSEDEREALTEELAGMTPTERLARIGELKRRYGDDYKALVKELSGGIDRDAALLAANADDAPLVGMLARGMEKAGENDKPAPTPRRGPPRDLPRTNGKTNIGALDPQHDYRIPNGTGETIARPEGNALVLVAAEDTGESAEADGGFAADPSNADPASQLEARIKTAPEMTDEAFRDLQLDIARSGLTMTGKVRLQNAAANIRAGKLDPESAFPDQQEQDTAVEALDRALLPAEFVDEERAADFKARTGFELVRGEGGFALTDAQGGDLFDLSEEEAAALERADDPDLFRRVGAMGFLWRDDLPPEERRRLLVEAIGGGGLPEKRGGTKSRASFAGDPKRILARRRLEAYDALATALEAGASDEELGKLIENYQAAMLPEVFGTGRFFRELLMDVVPGLGNVRSIRHLQNDIADVERAIETGEWGSAAMASGMAVLDATGILPGGNLLKAGGRRLAKGASTAARPFARLVPRKYRARWELARFMKKPKIPHPSATAKEYFAKVWDDLPPDMQTFLDKRLSNFVGDAGENIVGRNLDEAGFALLPKGKRRVEFPKGDKKKLRVFDNATSEEIKEGLLGIFARPKKGPKGSVVEVKTAGGKLTKRQEDADEIIPGTNKDKLASIAYLRVPANRIEPEDLADVVETWLEQPWRKGLTNPGGVPRKEIQELIGKLRNQTGPDGKLLDTGVVMTMAIGFALSVMYTGAGVPDTEFMSIDPNAA